MGPVLTDREGTDSGKRKTRSIRAGNDLDVEGVILSKEKAQLVERLVDTPWSSSLM